MPPSAGVPVQFLPAWNAVVAEGVERAAEVRYDPADPASSALRVMLPTYLVASWKVIRRRTPPDAGSGPHDSAKPTWWMRRC